MLINHVLTLHFSMINYNKAQTQYGILSMFCRIIIFCTTRHKGRMMRRINPGEKLDVENSNWGNSRDDAFGFSLFNK